MRIPAEWVRHWGPRIVHVDMKDTRIYEPHEERVAFSGVPLDFECPPLGQGVVDFRAMVSALREIGYQGFLSVEYSAHYFGYHEEPVGPLGSCRGVQAIHGHRAGRIERIPSIKVISQAEERHDHRYTHPYIR